MSVISVRTSDAVCRITLDRPEKLNALSDTVRRELTDAFSALRDDVDTRVVVLSGAGRSFSAGADLTAFSATGSGAQPPTWSQRRHAMGGWQRLLDLIESVPQATVASVHGHCIGGAALLAVACDIRVITTDAQVRIPELAIGIPLTWAGIPRLVREVGLPMARDLVMTGRALDGGAAAACGFAQRVCEPNGLAAATEGVVGELLAMPPAPLAMTRDMFAAISRERLGSTAWSDADLLGWSQTEDESRQAAIDYVTRMRKDR